MVGEDHRVHLLQKTCAPPHPITAMMTATPAGPGAHLETLQQHRIPPFQHLRVCQTAVRHMRMNSVRPIEIGTSPRPTTQRFIILIIFIAIDKVIHRSLRCRHHPQRTIQRIRDNLRGFDITGNHRRRILRAQHAIIGKDDLDRLQTALIHRDIIIDQRAEHIQHRRPAHRRRCVEIIGALLAGSGKINRG